MDRFLGKYAPYAYALMRIVVGLMFACHGAQKVLGLFGGFGEDGGTAPLFEFMWTAGAIELVGGLLIAVGFLAGWAGFICSGEMAVGYFMAHQPRALLPLENGGELALVYAFVFLYIAAHGNGKWSVADCCKPGAEVDSQSG